jgi:hypothetical protein
MIEFSNPVHRNQCEIFGAQNDDFGQFSPRKGIFERIWQFYPFFKEIRFRLNFNILRSDILSESFRILRCKNTATL